MIAQLYHTNERHKGTEGSYYDFTCNLLLLYKLAVILWDWSHLKFVVSKNASRDLKLSFNT